MQHPRSFFEFFCVAVLALVYMIYPCDSVTTLTSDQNTDGKWTFTEGTEVTLKCKMTSYTSALTWKYASLEAAKCVSSSCQQLLTGDGAFLFGFDLTNSVFYWTLSPIRMEHDKKLFECYDGSTTLSFTATVNPKGIERPEQIAIAGIVIVSLTFPLVIGVILVLCCFWTKKLRLRITSIEERLASHH